MTGTPGDGKGADTAKKIGRVRATWRTVQSLDADKWREIRDGAPLKFIRWLTAVGVVSLTWYLAGTPKSAVAWLPALVIVLLLLLPDASGIAFAGFSWQAREAADQAKRARDEAAETRSKIEIIFRTATEAGEAAGESAQARTAPQQPALDALRSYLLGSRSGQVDSGAPSDVPSRP